MYRKALTFKQIKQLSKNKSDNYVHKTLKKFVKTKILDENKIGNGIIYNVGLNVKAQNIIGFVAEYKAMITKQIPNIQNIINKIKTPYYTFIITGSYTKNKQNKESDLDIVIICDDMIHSQFLQKYNLNLNLIFQKFILIYLQNHNFMKCL